MLYYPRVILLKSLVHSDCLSDEASANLLLVFGIFDLLERNG